MKENSQKDKIGSGLSCLPMAKPTRYSARCALCPSVPRSQSKLVGLSLSSNSSTGESKSRHKSRPEMTKMRKETQLSSKRVKMSLMLNSLPWMRSGSQARPESSSSNVLLMRTIMVSLILFLSHYLFTVTKKLKSSTEGNLSLSILIRMEIKRLRETSKSG